MGLGRGDPGDGRTCLPGNEVRKLAGGLLGCDDDDVVPVEAPYETVELLRDTAEVFLGQLVDVALHAGLRPAALVVPARLLLRVVREPLEPAVTEAVEAPLLAADDDDEGTAAMPDERDERRQPQPRAHFDLVGHRLGERQRTPDAVEARAEDRQPLRAVAVELGLEPAPDAVEVLAQGDALPVVERVAARAVAAGTFVEEGVEPGLGVTRGRGDAGV